jgi:hypothetical protein
VTPVPREPAKGLALLEEVKALLAKDAITRIHGKASDGFFSTFFLTAKKSFRMETLAAVLQALQPGYWGATVDLKDAYLHVSVHHQSRKCLRFCFAFRCISSILFCCCLLYIVLFNFFDGNK